MAPLIMLRKGNFRMYIIMLGAPGTGKGTIGNEICKHFNLTHIATGDIFRNEIKNNTELGKKANEYISKGQLVPDEVTIAMVEKTLDDLGDNALLDGFPRTMNQAEALKKYLESKEKAITAVINLCVPDEDIVIRTSSRVICPNKACGASYNTKFMPPKVEGICDNCGGELIIRADDSDENAIRQRLEIYDTQTKPLVDFYNEKGIVIVEEISERINRFADEACKDFLNKIQG